MFASCCGEKVVVLYGIAHVLLRDIYWRSTLLKAFEAQHVLPKHVRNPKVQLFSNGHVKILTSEINYRFYGSPSELSLGKVLSESSRCAH